MLVARHWLPAVEQQAVPLDQMRICRRPWLVLERRRPKRFPLDPLVVELVMHACGLGGVEFGHRSHARDNDMPFRRVATESAPALEAEARRSPPCR